MAVDLVRLGWSLDYIRDLPIPDFNDLYASAMKVHLRQKLFDAWTMHAAQGPTKDFKKFLAPMVKAAGGQVSKSRQTEQDDSKAFLTAFPRGF